MAEHEGLAARMLDAAIDAGADAADLLVSSGDSLSVSVRNGALDQVERSEGVSLGIRVLVGRRQACVSAADTSDATIAAMVERAVAMAREAPEDPWCGLADPSELATDRDDGPLDLVDREPMPSPEKLMDAALAAEAAALAVPGVSKSIGAEASSTIANVYIAASNGFAGGFLRTSHGIGVSAIAGEGTAMERDYAQEGRLHRRDLSSPEEIGRLAGERTAARIGSGRPPTGAFPVVFDERVAGSLVAHLLNAANGAMVARGSSWLRDRMGEPVLPKGLDLVEDPRRKRTGGSSMFDAEGLPTAKRAVVRDGVLEGWILDLATARQLGLRSTANAKRPLASPPTPSPGNIALTPGAVGREGLLSEMGTGLLVTSLIGATINSTTGDYSRGASGFWVEGGEIVRPVNECTIAGNLRDMLRSIRPANDGQSWKQWVVPSLLVEGLVIAGA